MKTTFQQEKKININIWPFVHIWGMAQIENLLVGTAGGKMEMAGEGGRERETDGRKNANLSEKNIEK